MAKSSEGKAMRYEVTTKKKGKHSFAVCLLNVPEFPEDKENLDEIVRDPLLAVIGAVHGIDGWSFTSLSADEKHVIGDSMLDLGLSVNQWAWCTQYAV